MKNLLSAIEFLENKQELGTITMTEEAMLNSMIELAQEKIFAPKLKIV